MKKIAVLIDIDSRLDSILDTAFQLGDKHGSELIVYHYLPKNEVISIKNSEVILNGENLSARCKVFSSAYKVNFRIEFGTGKFRNTINRFVAEEKIDLIVMGSNGISNYNERLFGSHVEKVIESISCSVLVIKDIKLNQTINEVVFASSYNEMDKEILLYFIDLMKLSKDAIIHLLMIDTYSFFNQPTLVVEESFKDFAEIARPYDTKMHFYHGISVEEGITRFMKEEKPDLLIMSNKYSRIMRSAFSSGSKMIATLNKNQFPFLAVDYNTKKVATVE